MVLEFKIDDFNWILLVEIPKTSRNAKGWNLGTQIWYYSENPKNLDDEVRLSAGGFVGFPNPRSAIGSKNPRNEISGAEIREWERGALKVWRELCQFLSLSRNERLEGLAGAREGNLITAAGRLILQSGQIGLVSWGPVCFVAKGRKS